MSLGSSWIITHKNKDKVNHKIKGGFGRERDDSFFVDEGTQNW